MSKSAKYKRKTSLVTRYISKVSRKTKRKPALIEIMIPDELAEKIIQTIFNKFDEPEISSITLGWAEKVVAAKKTRSTKKVKKSAGSPQ